MRESKIQSYGWGRSTGNNREKSGNKGRSGRKRRTKFAPTRATDPLQRRSEEVQKIPKYLISTYFL